MEEHNERWQVNVYIAILKCHFCYDAENIFALLSYVRSGFLSLLTVWFEESCYAFEIKSKTGELKSIYPFESVLQILNRRLVHATIHVKPSYFLS